uniref:Uncharacterized protein n=1 Tax=Neobacillus citreus TaxID=2833578 RepID=A0A942SZ53_9BACI
MSSSNVVLMFAEHSSGASTYWAAVAATVPVLGLALIIEVRRTVGRWSLENRLVARLLMSVAYLYEVGALVYIMWRSLEALAIGRGTTGVLLVNVNLVTVTALILLVPTVYIVTRANPDFVLIVMRTPPWSKFAREQRAKVREAQAALRKLPQRREQQAVAVARMKERVESLKQKAERATRQQESVAATVSKAREQVKHLPVELRVNVEAKALEAEKKIAAQTELFLEVSTKLGEAVGLLETNEAALQRLERTATRVGNALRARRAWSLLETEREELTTALTEFQRSLREEPS